MAEVIPREDFLFRIPIHLPDLNLDRAHILRAMGYRDENIPPVVITEIDAVLSGKLTLPDICGGYRVLFSSSLRTNLQGCEYAALFTTTAGAAISERITDLTNAGEILLAYTWDCIGSEIAEAACDFLQKDLENKMQSMGLACTNRYSPGYCGWDVREQHKLFALLPPGFCGITLTASALMLPVKSVSGVTGIGRQVVKRFYGCAICTQEHCYKRKE